MRIQPTWRMEHVIIAINYEKTKIHPDLKNNYMQHLIALCCMGSGCKQHDFFSEGII
jgi:hypothetical protein